MSNGAHYNFIHATIDRVEADETIKTKVAAELAALKTALAMEDANLKVSRKSSLTDSIAEWDESRDDFYIGYKSAVSGFLKLPTGDMRTAAKALWQHIIDYSIDPKMQLDRQTGMMTNFIADLETKFATQVEALGLTVFREQMKEANDKVRELLKERDTELAPREVGATKTARRATDSAYQSLVRKVNAYAVIEGAADYQAFIDAMNAQIKRYKQEVLGQGVSGASSADTPADPSEPTDPTDPTTPSEPTGPEGGEEGGEEVDSPSEI